MDVSNGRVVEALLRARSLICDFENWIQGEDALNDNGVPVDPISPEAKCWCSSGAVRKAVQDIGLTVGEVEAVSEALRLASTQIDGDLRDFVMFNDFHGHDEVLVMFDLAIKKEWIMRVGDLVTWKSQATGTVKTKRGEIVEVVPANESPKTPMRGISALTRNHESYIVHVGSGTGMRNFYWPLVSRLNLVTPAAEAPASMGQFSGGAE